MKYKVLELYSGIGGLHFAFQESGLEFVVVGAVDINDAANRVYKYNFPETPLFQRNIESLTVADLESLLPNLIWMSPPCQPFTRNGLKKDCADYRTSSFLHVLDLLKQMTAKPLFILLENVKGFEESAACETMLKTLIDCGYTTQEYLLSPNELGIPNSRLRYYLSAKLKPLQFNCSTQKDFSFPSSAISSDQRLRTIEDYLEIQLLDYFHDYLLPDKVLLRYFSVLDIVEPQHNHSCCFTKSYGHYVEGTGSVLKANGSVELDKITSLAEQEEDGDKKLTILKRLNLRYFTPREEALLMGFPHHFRFPEKLGSKQKYKLLGNSLNVHVVCTLLKYISLGNP